MVPTAKVLVQTSPFHTTSIKHHIDRYDIWYQGGGSPAKVKNHFELYPHTLHYLAERVWSGKLLYIGGCAGAIMVGSCYEDAMRRTPTFFTMGLIPGMISIDTALLTMRPNDIQIPLTKQTAL